ncbi:hypothetical protein Ga0466249_004818 [Sporomusaceae bacterium BoRhaA]|uniref:hypothetical protein n=1 Tax=Pelorhabdus rhamnosifermentans TaxID=2772457 RepID=UPI001C05FDE8|nr:hypothetical protein [Pelorhabdus rhamnosifermentans]MBU2703670.1 hypothetical protein [Pelorhabdus rhamnosifermentans]
MSPCITRKATAAELAELDKLPKPREPIHYDRRPIFRRGDKGHIKTAGSGWYVR